MKRRKHHWIWMLTVVMLMLLAGCGRSEEEMVMELAGTWRMTVQDTEEEALYLLEHIELFEEEIVHVDLSSLTSVQLVEFREDGTYRFAYDAEGTKACIKAFYQDAFASLYENRTSLDAAYGQMFEPLSEEEFYQFYADLYEAGDFTTLIEYITDVAYDYEALAEAWETGSYTLEEGMILCMIDGETEAESIGYIIDGDRLTLTYVDGTEVYSR